MWVRNSQKSQLQRCKEHLIWGNKLINIAFGKLFTQTHTQKK